MKRILSLLVAMIMALGCVGITAMAEESTAAVVNTEADLKAALTVGGTVKLGTDITITSAITTSGVTATIDLNGKTLNVRAGDNRFEDVTNLTFENGTINIDGVVASANAIFRIDEYEKTLVTTVTLNNVNVTGSNYSSAFGIFYIGASSVLNVNGGTWTLSNDKYSAGGVFKADSESATLNIIGATMDLHNVRRVVTYADTTIEDSTLTISGDADGVDDEMKHGFNYSPLTIDNSTITMSNLSGRGITAVCGDVNINGSSVTITNSQEATIDVRGNQTVTVSADSTVSVDKEPTITSGSIDGTVVKVTTGLSGTGTEEDPYLINNLNELIWFRDTVNTYQSDGSNQFKGKYVKLNADIDLAGENWEPIGTNSVGDHMAFLGTFDGGNHTISNLYINADGDHLGFFARVGNYSEDCTPTIKNLKFNNVDVSANVTNHWTTGHGDYVGGVIANAGGNSIVSNVTVGGDVYVVGCGYVGGIVGHGYPDIDNCHVKANDGSYLHAGYWCAGGIIGYAGEGGTPITNCSVSGLDIWSAYGAAAAVAGLLQDGNTVTNVSAENVEITSDSDYCMGYIAGNGECSTMTEVTVTNVTATAKGATITATDAVAEVNGSIYFNLQAALKALTSGATLTLLADVTISDAWDCRYNGAKITVPVTIDGNGKTIKLTGAVDDKNWNTVFRFEDVATVKNLTIDVSEATGVQRGISSKLSITAENCKFIGNGSSSKRAIIFGEGAGDALSNVTATITGCTFTNWSYGVSDNQSGKDAKSVSVTGSNFNNASALVSASEAVTFTGNTVNNGYVNIKSYTADNTCNVTATGNTLDLTKGDDNKIDAGGEITAQDEFYIPAKGSNSLAYTKEVDGYVRVWGQSENTNAAESFVLKLYSEDTLMATTVLNDVNNIIDGSQDSVTWNFFYPESNDDYWTTTWEKGHPNALNKPTKVELYIDGTLVSTTAAQMNGADGVNPVVWEDLGGVRAIELPTATVTEIKNDELTFALNFKADEASEAQLAYYGDWFADYVLTVNKDVTFNANGGADGYLSGQYDAWSENWVNVPFEDVTLKANEPIKIMEYAAYIMGQSGLKLTYNDVYGFVKDFNCGVFFEEEFLAKNPDFEVTLELRMYNPKDESESYTIGEKYKFAASNIAKPVAKIGETTYDSLENALAAAKDGETVTLIWAEGDAPIAMNGAVFGKSVTITGTADVDWSKGFLFVGRGGEGNGTLTFDKANLTSASGQSPTGIGIHVSGREKNTNNKYDGTVIIKDSVIDLDYLINKGTMTLDNSTLTVKHGFSVGGRPASETESGVDATATITLNNNSKVIVNNHNGMGLGYEALGVMNIDATSEFETTQSFLVTEKGTMNIVGTAKIAGTLTNKGTINLKDVNATITAQEGVEVNSTVDGYEVDYTDGKYSLKEIEEVEKFKLALTNATLGNSLAINFIYAKSDIVGTDYVAKIKHTTATGVEEKEIPYTAWVSNGDYIYIPYDGISAKQMGDVVEITICKTDGTAVSETETESLENYAINYFNYYKNDSSMKLWKQAIADMLNYGAAAQTYFGYNADKLVNVTAADNVAEYASTKVNYAGEYKSGGEGAYATSLNLDNKIELIALFTGVTDDMTAKVEFTNHNGDSYSYEAELKKNGRYHEVIVDKLVIADINQPVKITVYNADGSEYAWIQDSINEYLGYIQNTGEADPLFEMASKFATSAYAAMHAND